MADKNDTPESVEPRRMHPLFPDYAMDDVSSIELVMDRYKVVATLRVTDALDDQQMQDHCRAFGRGFFQAYAKGQDNRRLPGPWTHVVTPEAEFTPGGPPPAPSSDNAAVQALTQQIQAQQAAMERMERRITEATKETSKAERSALDTIGQMITAQMQADVQRAQSERARIEAEIEARRRQLDAEEQERRTRMDRLEKEREDFWRRADAERERVRLERETADAQARTAREAKEKAERDLEMARLQHKTDIQLERLKAQGGLSKAVQDQIALMKARKENGIDDDDDDDGFKPPPWLAQAMQAFAGIMQGAGGSESPAGAPGASPRGGQSGGSRAGYRDPLAPRSDPE